MEASDLSGSALSDSVLRVSGLVDCVFSDSDFSGSDLPGSDVSASEVCASGAVASAFTVSDFFSIFDVCSSVLSGWDPRDSEAWAWAPSSGWLVSITFTEPVMLPLSSLLSVH